MSRLWTADGSTEVFGSWGHLADLGDGDGGVGDVERVVVGDGERVRGGYNLIESWRAGRVVGTASVDRSVEIGAVEWNALVPATGRGRCPRIRT